MYTSSVTCQQLIDAIEAGMLPCLKWGDNNFTVYAYMTDASVTSTSCSFTFGTGSDVIVITCSTHSSTISFGDPFDPVQ